MPRPLDGCRILDLGIITAGAATSAILADLGAEVIKIESPTYRDPFRLWPAGNSAESRHPSGPLFFRSNNRNKQGISLDLKHPDGKAVFRRLAANSDVVLENFRRGVMEGLGLGGEALREINPNLIFLAISSQGNTGMDRLQTSYGSTLEAVAGLSWMSGYAGDQPVITGRDINYPDQVVAMFATSMVLAAWLKRRQGGGGAMLDVSQRELTSYLLGETFLSMTSGQTRSGNADPSYAIQDCFLAADGRWVAVSIEEAALPALRQCIGTDRGDPASALAAWIGSADADGRVSALNAAGIPATTSLNGTEVFRTFAERSLAFVKAADGSTLKGLPFAIGAAMTVNTDAPLIGQDTRRILRDVAGYSETEISELAANSVIELSTDEATTAAAAS